MIAKFPKPIKIVLLHVISLVIIAGVSLHLVSRNLLDADVEFTQLAAHLFFGIFFLGTLVLGVGSVFRPVFLIGINLLRKGDLNEHLIREEIQLLILFVLEICLGLAVLFFGGFIKMQLA